MTRLPSDPFSAWLSGRVDPALRERGYSRTDSSYHRRAPAGWGVVSFQRSQFGKRELVRFTVNLGVALDRLTVARGDDPSRKPAEHRCVWRCRIGAVSGAVDDRWWELAAATDLERLTVEVLPTIIEPGLRLVEERLTEEGFVAALAATPRVGQVARFTDAEVIELLSHPG